MTISIIPTLRYTNASGMIDWLCEAFGFERQAVYEDGKGGIAHAQLTFGNGMIMLGDDSDSEFSRYQSTPRALGGTTQSPYLVVADVDAVCERARGAGARIVIGPRDEDYGGRGFVCVDPEGHVWSFGSYDPMANGSASPASEG